MNLVLVHGLLGSSLNWGPILTRLRSTPELSNWTFTAVDLLGHAYRQVPAEKLDISMDEMADDLLAQFPPGPVVALGHSFGLRPLLEITSRYPDRLTAIIAEDSGPEIKPSSFEFLRKVFDQTPVPFSSRETAKEFFEKTFGVGSALARFLLSNIQEKSPANHNWRFAHGPLRALLERVAHSNQWREWEAFEGPIYMIRGELSDFISSEGAAECIARRKAKVTELYQINQSGHWVHSEQAGAFTECLIKVLKKNA